MLFLKFDRTFSFCHVNFWRRSFISRCVSIASQELFRMAEKVFPRPRVKVQWQGQVDSSTWCEIGSCSPQFINYVFHVVLSFKSRTSPISVEFQFCFLGNSIKLVFEQGHGFSELFSEFRLLWWRIGFFAIFVFGVFSLLDLPSEVFEEEFWLLSFSEDFFLFIDVVLVVNASNFKFFDAIHAYVPISATYRTWGIPPQLIFWFRNWVERQLLKLAVST